MVGAAYDISDVTTLTGQFANALGTMAETDVEASTMSLRLDFDLVEVQGLSVFAQVAQRNSFQDESDGSAIRDNTFSFGATYLFGASGPGSTMADLGYLEN